MFDYERLEQIKDPIIREAVEAAIRQNLMTACTNYAYPGQFSVTADGRHFGEANTWPGLDSWQMAGAYLLLGMPEVVLGYFDFVEHSQRADGNIPFAIYPAEDYADPKSRETCAKLRYPEDIFSYIPPDPDYPTRQWIGQFRHWVIENPLSLLGPICYPLTAREIFDSLKDKAWLKEKLPSLERACRYIITKKDDRGLIGGAGFYIELPPRQEWDGITQCYCYKAFGDMADLYTAVEEPSLAAFWRAEANGVRKAFLKYFWKREKFAEYIHPTGGPVDWHGMSDVDFAAIGFGLATPEQVSILWPKLQQETAFWWGDMPTQAVTRPYTYRDWELGAPVNFFYNGPIYDMAAIGRVWYVETQAIRAMKDWDRLRQSARLVAQAGLKEGGYWYERYHMLQDRRVSAAGPKGYCEYPAILVRTVLGNWEAFTQ